MKKVKYGHRDYAPKDGCAPPHGYKTSRREFLQGATALAVAHPIFPLLQLGKANRGGRPVLSDLSFSVADGQMLLVTGANGSGKTTLLRTMVGEVPALNGMARLGHKVMINYYAQAHEGLEMNATVLQEIRRIKPDFSPRGDMARLQGTWKLFKLVKKGEFLVPRDAEMTWKITGATVSIDGGRALTCAR